MAVRLSAAEPPAPRPPPHRRRRVQLPRPPVRRTTRRSRSTRRSPRTPGTRSRGTGWSTRRSTRPRARRTRGCGRACSAARRTSGAAARCATGRCSSTPPACDGYDVDWPISLRRRQAATTTRWTSCSAARAPRKGSTRSRTASSSGRASSTASRSSSSARSRRWAATTSPAARASPPTGVLNNKYRSRCLGPRALRPRLRHQRRVPLADRARLPGARQREPHHPAVFGRLRGVPRRGHRARRRRARHRREHARGDGLQGHGGRARRGHPRHHAHPAQLEVAAPSRRAWATRPASSAAYLSEHAMGAARQRVHPAAHRHRGHARRRPSRHALRPALPQRHGQAPRLHPRLSLPGRRRRLRVPGHGPRPRRASARRSSRPSASTTRP